MRVLMPRCRKCVLCGDPIEGKGRIDRIYCSASCRTLAWRARAGHRWTGRRKTRASQPGDYVARSALPVLAVRMKAELDAAKRRIAELEAQASTRRGAAASTAVKAAVVTGAAGLTAAVLRHRAKRHRAELERVQAEAKAEQDRLRAEQAGERQQATHREAKLEHQVAELTSRCQSAEGHKRLAASSVQELTRQTEALRREVSERDEALGDMHWQVAGVRRELRQALSQGETVYKALLAEKELSKSLDGQLGGVWQQLEAERQSWQHQHARLTSEVWEAHRLVDDNYCHLWGRLSAMESRAETAETALATLQARTEGQKLLVGEPVQRVQTLMAPAKEPRKKKKLPTEAAEQKRLPAQASTLETIAMVAGSAVMGGSVALGARALLGGNKRKRLPPKEVGTYFEVTPVPERKRLPPAK